jgi:hypothetical protein
LNESNFSAFKKAEKTPHKNFVLSFNPRLFVYPWRRLGQPNQNFYLPVADKTQMRQYNSIR